MKPILLLIPMPSYGFNREIFVKSCIKDCIEKNELPISNHNYNWCGNISPVEVNETILSLIEKVVIYNNFPISNLEEKLINKAICNGKEVEYREIYNFIDQTNQLSQILSEVSNFFNISIEHLKSSSRYREITDARFIYYKRARETTLCSLRQIGALVNRDHASVLHGISEVNNTLEVTQKFQRIYAIKTTFNYAIMQRTGSEPSTGELKDNLEKTRSVLPYVPMEERIEIFSKTEPIMRTLPCKRENRISGNG